MGVFKNAEEYGYKIFNRYARYEEHEGDEMDAMHLIISWKLHTQIQEKIVRTQYEIMIQLNR